MPDPRRLSARVLGGTFLMTILCILFYCYFLPQSLSFTEEEKLSFWFRMGTVGLIADFLATFIVYRLYRPVARALRREGGTDLDPDLRRSAIAAIAGIPNFLLWFGSFAYVAAAAVNLGLDFAKNGSLVLGLALARLSLAAAWGFLNGIVIARLLDIILFDAKIALGIHHIEEIGFGGKRRAISFARRLAISGFALFAFLVIFAGVLFYTRSIAISREAVAQALAAAASGNALSGPAAEEIVWKIVEAKVPAGLWIFLGLLALAGLLYVIILAEIQTRLTSLLSQMERLARGDRDLAARVKVTGFDDIGRMTSGFNRILDSFAATFAAVKARAGQVHAESSSIKLVSLEARKESEQLALLADETEVAERDRVAELARSMVAFRKVTSNIEASASKSAAEAREIESAAEGLKAMTASFAASGAEAARAEQAFLALKESAARGAEGVARSLETAASIEEAGNRVGGIATVIEGVADRSNLLAMNASIEAAHAGAAGKGFSVVAREMKKLAESVGKSAKDIATEVAGVQEKNRRAVDAIKGLGLIFEELSKGIGATGEALAVIASSARHNADEARADLALVERLRSFTGELLSASDGAKDSVGDMVKAVDRLTASQERSGEVNAALAEGVRSLGEVFAKLEGSLGQALEGISALDGELSTYNLG